MNDKFQNFIESIIPFLLFGIAIALGIGLVIVFSYVLFWGLVIGLVIWVIFWIKNYFYPTTKTHSKQSGRVIDHDKKD